MSGVNEAPQDGQARNLPRAPLPPGVTTASACSDRDPSGRQLALCSERAIHSIRSDAGEFFGIVDEGHLAAIETAARSAHAFTWAVATRQAAAYRVHEYAGMGLGGGMAPGLPYALRRFPAALSALLLGEEKDERDAAALVAQNAAGTHEMIEAALSLGAAHVAAAAVARDLVTVEQAMAYATLCRHPSTVGSPMHRPIATRYLRPECDVYGTRLVKGREVAASALCKWASERGVSGDALGRMVLDVGCAYSVGFSLARIIPQDGHQEWLHTEMRPEPLLRAAGLALQVAREPKLAGRPLDVEVVIGDFIHGAIVRDIPTFSNVMAASLAIRAAVAAVVAPREVAPEPEPEPEVAHVKRAKGGKS